MAFVTATLALGVVTSVAGLAIVTFHRWIAMKLSQRADRAATIAPHEKILAISGRGWRVLTVVVGTGALGVGVLEIVIANQAR